MYKITLYTSQGEFHFIADVTTLPDDEFIEAKNQYGQLCGVNRNAILFYKVIKKRG